ncbi:nidogen-2 isoform X26 [Amblyraja radiata]|uniref:nidogen-2 isoform X26 n=1 Tax=Amblyraja radiata TaxID=386614 RepID=UPI0014028CF1|nr:nidogen-2 isoform X26 [Amblyraja radiata]
MQRNGLPLCLLLHWTCLVSALQRKDLFPFGPHTGDVALQEGDDVTSEAYQLRRPLAFYDTQFNSLYVGTNGIISLQELPRESQYVDDGFPIDFPVIAPYLSDIDTSQGRGRIYYREDHSPDTLERVGWELRKAFPGRGINPGNSFIATWENVAPYEEMTRSNPSSNRFNTFQAVLVFDESDAYAIFLYPEDGLNFFGTRPKDSYNVPFELPARVGFSRGETEFTRWRREGSYYSVTTNEQSVKNLYQMGNSGSPGIWIFHIGGASSFNNIMQADVRGQPSAEDTVVTLDSALSGPATPDAREPDYTANEDYKYYYEGEDFGYASSISTSSPGRDGGIPDDPPYPDAGIIPSYPAGYPETGIMSSYPESGVLSSYPERDPEVGTGVRYPDGYSEVESLPGNPQPVTQDRHVVSVVEDGNLGTGVFTYNTDTRETCARSRQQCSQHAYCADYSSGLCCHCHPGYYGNGRQCLQEGVTQRVNGKVNGKLIVGSSRVPVEFKNADLHAYVVVNDGRAFTAISQIPESVGWAMQSLSVIGDLFGWLFAVQQPGFANGFSIAGAKFIRSIDITFYPGNEQLNIMQIARGLDAHNYLSVTTEIEGELPDISAGATIQIQPYEELLYRSTSAVTSTANRDYSVEAGNGEKQTHRYQLRQNITYYDCEHAPKTIPDAQQLNADHIFVLYDRNEQVIRYATINRIGPARGNPRPDSVNPCQDGSHNCDPKAQCYALNDHEHICTCAPGYEGDGKVCKDIDECAGGSSHGCGANTECVNVPGSYGCECKQGYAVPEGGNTCVPTTATSERQTTACEQQRDQLEAEVRLRGSQPLVGHYIPQCDEEGNFRPMQCHGSTGHCWCVYENGQEVLGSRTLPGTAQPRCGTTGESERPKTACEQQRDRLEAEVRLRGSQPLLGHHIPQCDEEGNFRPMQCQSSTGHCWCVYENGQEVLGSRTPSGTAQPRCGTTGDSERPKSACEQQRDRLEAEVRLRGSQPLLGHHISQCDEEGNFRQMQCQGSTGHCWCVYGNGQEVPGSRTLPGTAQPRCGTTGHSERPKSACEQQRDRLEAEVRLRASQPLLGHHIPQCDEEGNFRPMQCQSSTGHCWCVYENGQEVLGSRTPPGTPQPRCGTTAKRAGSERPKSACEQQRDRLEAEVRLRGSQPLVGHHIPQCDEEGNFRPIQCQSSTGHCWCVYESGQEIPGSRTPPGTAQLRCGMTVTVEASDRPKSACEQQRDRLEAEVRLRGSQPLVGHHIPQCDEEGNFRPMQCHSSTGHCWCVYENGQEVLGSRTLPGTGQPRCGTTATTAVSERPKSACEQQRDRLEAEVRQHGSQPQLGLYIPQCDEEGNFRLMQCHSSTGHCWCVHGNGQEVPGTRAPPGTSQPRCGTTAAIDRPKSACEQHRERMEAEVSLRGPLVGFHVPQCDEEGNFRPMQCQSSTGHCWCVYENGQEVLGTRTPPGTTQPRCGTTEASDRPKSACEQQRDRLEAEVRLRGSQPLLGHHIPQCDEEGNFRPMQCQSSTGHCWCVHENGQEVLGSRTPPGTTQPRCGTTGDSERPKSACEQQRDRLEAEVRLRGSQPLVGHHIPQCDEEGNFRPMQCHGSTGHCWCVYENGQEVPGSRTPPGTPQPRCGTTAADEQPKSACEQHRERMEAEVSLRGPIVGLHIPQCDEEGNFRPVQCQSSTGHCWCVHENGQEVQGTRTPSGTAQPRCGPTVSERNERPKTACEEQQQRLQMEMRAYGPEPLLGHHIPQCDEEGNFRLMQCHSSTGHCWCVYENGQEVPGTRIPPGTAQPHCDLPATNERPQTDCEEQRERLQAEMSRHGSQRLGLHIPQCDEAGRFRTIQCHGSTGHCWCVNESGREIPGTRTPPGTGQIRCGSAEQIEQPKNACARHHEQVQRELSAHGSDPPVGVYIPQCDEEGNYQEMQCHSSTAHCWCVDVEGQEVPGTSRGPGSGQPRCGQTAPTEAPKAPCAEQRDQLQEELSIHRARPAVGVYVPQCDALGNFKPLQCHGSTDQCWCVDELGREIPGTRTLPGSDQPRCGLPEPLQRPQTVCERWRSSLLEHYGGSPADDQYVPRCTEFGEFSPLQCHGNSGYCWCVDQEGREMPGTRTEPGTPPACIPTVPPPVTQPTTASVVTVPPAGAFLLYAQGQHIGYLPLNGTRLNKNEARSLLALHGSIIIGIDYDCRDKMVYWTDVAGRTINRVSLEAGAEPEIIINSGLTSPEGLTLDYHHRRMFWTDSGSDKIETAAFDGSERRVLVDTDLVNPRAIVVDSAHGNLYWTDWNREAPKIETSRVDGTNRRILINKDIGLPNGLTFDRYFSQLCWADAGTKDLECVNPDGSGRRVIQSGLNYPFSIVAYSNHFYYTDWKRDGIIVLPKVGRQNQYGSQILDEYLPDQRSHLYGITVAYPSCP